MKNKIGRKFIAEFEIENIESAEYGAPFYTLREIKTKCTADGYVININDVWFPRVFKPSSSWRNGAVKIPKMSEKNKNKKIIYVGKESYNDFSKTGTMFFREVPLHPNWPWEKCYWIPADKFPMPNLPEEK